MRQTALAPGCDASAMYLHVRGTLPRVPTILSALEDDSGPLSIWKFPNDYLV
jgi:hypothetical protein